MPIKTPITQPANYVTPTAVGFADSAGDLSLVAADVPLPVSQMRTSAPAALAGQASGTAQAGPFVPARDVPVHVQLSGTWAGQVALVRSTDGGATRLPLTAGGMPWGRFTANANEVVWQEGDAAAALYLDIALTSGTVSYRVSQ